MALKMEMLLAQLERWKCLCDDLFKTKIKTAQTGFFPGVARHHHHDHPSTVCNVLQLLPSQYSLQCALPTWPHPASHATGRRAGVAEGQGWQWPLLPSPTWREALNSPGTACSSDRGADSRNTVSDCPAWNLDQISFSVLWDPARMFELGELLGNNRGKSFSSNQRRKWGHVRENNMVAPRSVEKGRGGAPSTRVKILLQALVRTVVKQLPPCSPWSPWEMQRSTHSLWDECSRSNRWMPEKAVWDVNGDWGLLLPEMEGPCFPTRAAYS